MMTTLPRIFVDSPRLAPSPRMVVAGQRAGALGVLNLSGLTLGHVSTRPTPNAEIAKIAAIVKDRGFAVKVSAEAVRSQWLQSLPPEVSTLVVEGGFGSSWILARDAIESSGRIPVAEVTSRETALDAIAAGFEALVVAGHEAGGLVSSSTAFILLQAILKDTAGSAQVWVRGGIGPQTASACLAAGAAGVVLDGALLLAKESPLSEEVRTKIATWDGSETIAIPTTAGRCWRVHAPKNSSILERLNRAANQDAESVGDTSALANILGWRNGDAWPVGQDAAFAEPLARRYLTVGGIVQAVEKAIEQGWRHAKSSQAIREGSPLALALGTRYPIAQGPMTRVSDRPEFAEAVAKGGALPFLALALMPAKEIRPILAETSRRLGDLPWGVGLLGFVPRALREEQTEAILEVKPPFALIAGGRPDQANAFEKGGISTFLHVPSPNLLAQYLREGARRFVLEGRECGGHVGPRSSFVLWEQAANTLIDAVDRGQVDPAEVQLLYAGGIHDGRSSAFVSVITAPLTALGVRVGVLLGTPYLFTEEAIRTGAIVEGFQNEAIRCASTVLLETGPGHVVRATPGPFADRFERERTRLYAEGRTHEQTREFLEALNVGRLRVAAKGVDRLSGADSGLTSLTVAEQRERGLYMIGESATLRDEPTTIAELHHEITNGAAAILDPLETEEADRGPKPTPCDVAIIGMSAIFPGAPNVRRFWDNSLNGFDAITQVPEDRWNAALYYDPDPKAKDKITSKWGGFIPEIPFDPLDYGMPPASLPSIEPLHLITLEAVRAALDDAGYKTREFPRERTSVILGAGGGASQLAMGYALRSYLPLLDTAIPGAGTSALNALDESLPAWTEDSFPGILMNVAAGRVANRFDLGGSNYTVDAACGSSLAATVQAVRELEIGAADMVVLGGADTVQNPFTYLAFSKTHAFSPKGRCRPFDASADGIVISEGVGVVILKRLADAQRDGDRIYAVIKGTGASSDGRAKGLTAPNNEGQTRALRRAYEKAGIDPSTVGYVEAHGTGTAAGDVAETQALSRVYSEANAPAGACVVGSVKSQIGHAKCAAGLAGLIHATLAIYHKVIPPTIGIKTPNPKAKFGESPFQLNGKAKPWLRTLADQPRRAGVSAFGFGGTNFHVVLEAYQESLDESPAPKSEWPAELFAWQGESTDALIQSLDELERVLASTPSEVGIAAISKFVLNRLDPNPNGPRLAIVAESTPDLSQKLKKARTAIAGGSLKFHEASGIDFESKPVFQDCELAFVFPGQGSQRPGMLADLMIAFPEAIEGFEAFDQAYQSLGKPSLAESIYPGTVFQDQQHESQKRALAATEIAQPALGACSTAMLGVLRNLGIEPAAVAGHSYGELVALHAAGSLSNADLALLSEARGRLLAEAGGSSEPDGMLALSTSRENAGTLLKNSRSAALANHNGPSQVVLAGLLSELQQVKLTAESLGIRSTLLNVSRAFHSARVASVETPLVEAASALDFRGPAIPVFSNVTKETYSASPTEFAKQIGRHAVSPVEFAGMIVAMYEAGSRIFVEVGPGSVLTGLVGAILKDRPHLAVACEPSGRPGLSGFLGSLSKLFAGGITVDLRRLTARRSLPNLTLGRNGFESPNGKRTASTWMVNGARARPWNVPETKLFGTGPALPIQKTDDSGSRNRIGRPLLNGHVDGPSIESGELVFNAFQETMRNFLEVQRTATLGFLSRTNGNGNGRNGHSAAKRASVAEAKPVPIEPPLISKAEAPTSVETRLLEIIKDRTGYPLEMLKRELDLEAELGIDSIKRVEIIGSLRDSFDLLKSTDDSRLMDSLAKAATIGAIVDAMQAAMAPKVADVSIRATIAKSTKRPDRPPIQRKVVELRVLPSIPEPIAIPIRQGGTILILADGLGIAHHVAERLANMGFRCRIVSKAETMGMIRDVVADSPICAIVDLMGLDPESSVGSEAESKRFDHVRALFLLAKEASEALELSAKQGGTAILSATRLGGDFGLRRDGGSLSVSASSQGTITGLLKTFAKEWPTIRSRVVDLPERIESAQAARIIVRELSDVGSEVEVGDLEGRRYGVRVVAEPLDTTIAEPLTIRPGGPIFITGGARGITARIALELARVWRPTLLLVGSSPLPMADPALASLDHLDEPSAIKAALLKRHNGSAAAIKPNDLEREYQAFRRDREIRANLQAFREAGATVHYRQVDVRDPIPFKAAIERWQAEFGPFEGFIHGAGVIEDKRIREKSLESFDRVLTTKLASAYQLVETINPSALKFGAFFGSVSGRFGNRGQCDYAAANDGLNKLAVALDRRWPGRFLTVNWGPWAGIGLGAALEDRLLQQGLSMIDPEDGATQFINELRFGTKGRVEVVLAGTLGPFAGPSEALDPS